MNRRGYTVIEVMIAIALLGIASSGIIALQKVTAIGNLRAKSLSTADQIARTWIERLHGDATAWNYPSPSAPGVVSNINQTVWLANANTNANAWFRPAENPRGTAAFDVLGNDIPDANAANAAYCANVRLAWLYPNTLIRADVRVFWLREGGAGPVGGTPFCSPNAPIGVFDVPGNLPVARFHAVYLSASIAQNTMP